MFILFRPEFSNKGDTEASQVSKERVAGRQEWLDVETHCICALDHSMGLSIGVSILVTYSFPWTSLEINSVSAMPDSSLAVVCLNSPMPSPSTPPEGELGPQLMDPVGPSASSLKMSQSLE